MEFATTTRSILIIATLLAGCDATTYSTPEAEVTHKSTTTVSGTALYRERISLPPGARFEATLEDVSLADAPARVIGQVAFEAPPGPPIEFEISYNVADIDPNRRYAVRARIEQQRRLIFTTDTHYPVLTQDAPDTVEVLLVHVATPPLSNASLENTYWKVMSIRGEPVTVAERQREPHLILQPGDQRVSAHGGCNAMMGRYEIKENQVRFLEMAGTMMACPEGMEQEQALYQALREVVLWQVAGEQLQLLNGEDIVILELESRYME